MKKKLFLQLFVSVILMKTMEEDEEVQWRMKCKQKQKKNNNWRKK